MLHARCGARVHPQRRVAKRIGTRAAGASVGPPAPRGASRRARFEILVARHRAPCSRPFPAALRAGTRRAARDAQRARRRALWPRLPRRHRAFGSMETAIGAIRAGGRSSSTRSARCRRACRPKLVRALQERTIRPVGGDTEFRFDARIVAGLDDLPERIRAPRSAGLVLDSNEAAELAPMHEVERRYILRVLQAVAGDKTLAAKVLGVDRAHALSQARRDESRGQARRRRRRRCAEDRRARRRTACRHDDVPMTRKRRRRRESAPRSTRWLGDDPRARRKIARTRADWYARNAAVTDV